MKSRDFLKNCLFYCQEMALDAATPGSVAKERLIRNANILKDSCECWLKHCGLSPEELWKEMWQHEPEAYQRYKERERKDGKGRKGK